MHLIDFAGGGVPPNRFVTEMAVFCSVDGEDKHWKINKQTPQTVITKEATSMLSQMCAETVKRSAKGRDMEDVAHKDKFVIQ